MSVKAKIVWVLINPRRLRIRLTCRSLHFATVPLPKITPFARHHIQPTRETEKTVVGDLFCERLNDLTLSNLEKIKFIAVIFSEQNIVFEAYKNLF